MVHLDFSAVLISVILLFLAIKVNSRGSYKSILSWKEDHFIKELSDEDIPEDCKKIGICSNITIYDTQFVNKHLRNLRRFNEDYIRTAHVYSRLKEVEELCESKEQIIWPQAAKDKEDRWQYIVNTNAIRYQSYRIERCNENGSRCMKAATFEGFDDACYQEYYLRKMVYIDVKNHKFSINDFKVPSCCSCKITENYQ